MALSIAMAMAMAMAVATAQAISIAMAAVHVANMAIWRRGDLDDSRLGEPGDHGDSATRPGGVFPG